MPTPIAVTHLDTSFLVDLLRDSRHRTSPAWKVLDELAEEPLGGSVHVVCELMAGAEFSRDPDAERERVVHPNDRFPDTHGLLLAQLTQRGERVPWTCSSARPPWSPTLGS